MSQSRILQPPLRQVLWILCAIAFASAAMAQTFSPDEPVATVNGEKITWDELRVHLDQTLQQYQGYSDLSPQEQVVFKIRMADQLLDKFMEKRLLLQEGSRRGITVSDEIATSVGQGIYRDQTGRLIPFDEYLKRAGYSPDAFRQFARQQAILQRLKRDVERDAPIPTEEEIKAYYDAHPSEFHLGEQVHASHILIHVPLDAKPEESQKALDRVVKMIDELRAGADFGKMARENSDDASNAVKGGDLGYFGRGEMVPEFEQFAFDLKPGEISGPVKTAYGYHIIKKIGAKPPISYTYEQAHAGIMDKLHRAKQDEFYQKWLQDLKKHAKMEKLVDFSVPAPS
ncbi:MAG: peptidylprolyl isomerase [bacterium]